MLIFIFMKYSMKFSSGIFPKRLKFARVSPIHKANSKLALTCFRPISVLHVISKLLEQLTFLRLNNFLTKNKVSHGHQCGFQKENSTYLAILEVYWNLIKSFDKQTFSCSIFLDFVKAVDTENHDILLNRMVYAGIRGAGLKYLWS